MKALKKIICIIIIAVLNLSIVTGCWDRLELEDIFFIYSIGIDRSEDNPELISLSLSAPAIEEEAKDPNVRIVSQGLSIEYASNSARSKLYRELGYGQLEIIMFGEDTAKEGIAPLMDYFDRNPKVKGTVVLAVTRGNASEFLTKLEPDQHPHIGIFLRELIMGLEHDGIAPATTIREFYRTLNMDGKDPFMPFMILSDDEEGVVSCHIAVFNDDKFVAVLNKDQSIAVMILNSQTNRGRISFRMPEGVEGEMYDSLSVSFINSSRKIKPQIVNGRVNIKVDIKIDAAITEHTPSLRTISRPSVERLQRILEEQVKSDIKKVIGELQKNQTDIIGFGEYVRVKYPKFFDKEKWRDDFSRAEFEINVEFTLRRAGMSA